MGIYASSITKNPELLLRFDASDPASVTVDGTTGLVTKWADLVVGETQFRPVTTSIPEIGHTRVEPSQLVVDVADGYKGILTRGLVTPLTTDTDPMNGKLVVMVYQRTGWSHLDDFITEALDEPGSRRIFRYGNNNWLNTSTQLHMDPLLHPVVDFGGQDFLTTRFTNRRFVHVQHIHSNGIKVNCKYILWHTQLGRQTSEWQVRDASYDHESIPAPRPSAGQLLIGPRTDTLSWGYDDDLFGDTGPLIVHEIRFYKASFFVTSEQILDIVEEVRLNWNYART